MKWIGLGVVVLCLLGALFLVPGSFVIKSATEREIVMSIGYKIADGSTKLIWHNRVWLEQYERLQCFFYDVQIDRKQKSRVQFHYFSERPPVPLSENEEAPSGDREAR